MNTETIICNHLEAIEQRKRLASEKYKLQKRLQLVSKNLRLVEGIIEENDSKKQNWTVELPIKVLCRNEILSMEDPKINWKSVSMDLITKYQMPMSSELLYHKLLLNYGKLPFDRKFIIKNISAALHYLEAKDQRLFRIKDENKRCFIYGLKQFFDINLNLKAHYLNEYLRESGKMTIV